MQPYHRQRHALAEKAADFHWLVALLCLLQFKPLCALPVEVLVAAAQPTPELIRSRIPRPVIVNLPLGTKPEGLCAGRAVGEFYVAGNFIVAMHWCV
jgi:hypothetical protein